MVLHLIAMGVFAAVGHGVNHLIKEHEAKKKAEAFAIRTMTKAPDGYAPQPSLLFDYTLEPGEELIATFAFTPCKWTKELFASNEMFPRPFGMTLGIGHVTSHRVLLMYDLKRIERNGWWSSEKTELVGKFGGEYLSLTREGKLVIAALEADRLVHLGKIIEHAVNETVGKLFEGLSHIDSETRKHMERVAKLVPKGVVSCERGGDWGMANGCVFFKMTGYESVNYPMTFGPSFIDSDASGDEIEIFKKIMQFGPANVNIEKKNTLPWFGSRKGLESFVL